MYYAADFFRICSNVSLQILESQRCGGVTLKMYCAADFSEFFVCDQSNTLPEMEANVAREFVLLEIFSFSFLFLS